MSVQNNFNVGVAGPYYTVELAEGKAMDGVDKIKLSGLDRLEILMAQFEKALDWSGAIPGLNLISSPVRFLYGTVQLITALVMKVIAALGTVFADEKEIGYWEKFHNRASNHIVQGGANQLRALGEFIPFFNLFWLFQVMDRDSIRVHQRPENSPFCKKIKLEDRVVGLSAPRIFYEGELKLLHLVNYLKQTPTV